MKIEAGKYYKTRDGRKVGPVEERPYNTRHPFGIGDGRWIFGSDGANLCVRNLDLIAEWTDGPVRTVTRTVTEIVPGDYDRVCVRPLPDGRVDMSLHGCVWTAPELKAAAAVLLELAGALEE